MSLPELINDQGTTASELHSGMLATYDDVKSWARLLATFRTQLGKVLLDASRASEPEFVDAGQWWTASAKPAALVDFGPLSTAHGFDYAFTDDVGDLIGYVIKQAELGQGHLAAIRSAAGQAEEGGLTPETTFEPAADSQLVTWTKGAAVGGAAALLVWFFAFRSDD